jgi:hypothetical protein
MEDILAITFLFGGGSLFLLAISPVGRAIADRIRGAGSDLPRGAGEQIRESQIAILEELEALRRDVTEVQERLDFAERILAQQREQGQLPGG